MISKDHGGTPPGVRTFAEYVTVIEGRRHWASNQEIADAGYPYVMLSNKFKITDDFVKWCNKQFGYKNWVNRNTLSVVYIFFSKEEDATAFRLRWALNEL